ncbi:MAG: phosphate acyltransferase PlsX [Finegoldia sp.]|nr:phosphate acyltransferase PlsX [Finegoldia sp.]
MNILLDTLGSDMGEVELVEGAIKALDQKDFKITLVGNEEKNREIVAGRHEGRISYIDARDVIDNNKSATREIRSKKDSSMRVAFERLNEDEYDGMLSAGSTGALLTGATLITKRLKNVKRPALIVVLPTLTSNVCLLDVGANVDCSSDLLVQFAKMGYVYSKNVLGKKDSKIGLLNIGVEEHKGDSLRLETYEKLKEYDFFKGNVEARDVLKGEFDVVITDGFTGNVFLKAIEGIGELLGYLAKAKLKSMDPEIAGKIVKSLGSSDVIDYKSVGSAPFLGTRKPVFKSHGSSDRQAISNGILTLIKFIEEDVTSKLEEALD